MFWERPSWTRPAISTERPLPAVPTCWARCGKSVRLARRDCCTASLAGRRDGEYPLAGVIVDAAGNLYGNTETGGAANVGTVYEISKSGKFTLLHSFDGTDGKYPYGSFAQEREGHALRHNPEWRHHRLRDGVEDHEVGGMPNRCGRGSELAELSSGIKLWLHQRLPLWYLLELSRTSGRDQRDICAREGLCLRLLA